MGDSSLYARVGAHLGTGFSLQAGHKVTGVHFDQRRLHLCTAFIGQITAAGETAPAGGIQQTGRSPANAGPFPIIAIAMPLSTPPTARIAISFFMMRTRYASRAADQFFDYRPVFIGTGLTCGVGGRGR